MTLILSSPVFQTVLSYSTQTGDRRTRVHTLTLRCSPHLQDTFRHYQAQALLTFYCKKSVDLVLCFSKCPSSAYRQKPGKKGLKVFFFNIFWSVYLVYCAVLERPLQELREELQTDVTEALAAYRKHCCSASVSTGQVRFKTHNILSS